MLSTSVAPLGSTSEDELPSGIDWDSELADHQIWTPETELGEPAFPDYRESRRVQQLQLRPSQFTEYAFYLPSEEGVYSPFSFAGRRHMRRCYDTPAKRILLFCARQVEKCVSIVSSSISLASGLPLLASQLKAGDRVLNYATGSQRMGSGRVVAKESVGLKRCIKVSTRQGQEVQIATTHPMLTEQGWLEGRHLQVGTRLAALRRGGEFIGDVDDGEQWVKLCPYLIADGGLGDGVNFTKAPGTVLEDFLAQLRDVYSAAVRSHSKKGTTSQKHQLSDCAGLKQKLQSVGLAGKLSAQKFVPADVFRYSREHTALFLNRLWSCDGHVKRHSNVRYSIEYGSISLQLVRQVQALLWKFGIPTSFRKYKPKVYQGTDKWGYLIRVETKLGVHRFLTEIGALGKSEGVPLPDTSIPERNNRDTIPSVFVRNLVRVALPVGASLRKLGLVRFPKEGVTQDRLRTFIDRLRAAGSSEEQLRPLERFIDADIFWDEVETLEDIGEQECFDIQVEQESSFILNGLVSHNSTLLGNRALAYMCLIPAFRVLYVSPSAKQTVTFSNDRVKEPIDTSPILSKFTNRMLSQNIMEKQFANRSKITMRYAFLNADRARGIPAWALMLDEFQDLLSLVIPVVEQCLSHAPENFRYRCYAGTPKSLDNNLEIYRARYSTQGEWVVPCDRCGGVDSFRFWNILGEKNIQKHGLSCEKCGKLINPQHPDAQWANMVADAPFESYRIPQLMVPWVPWDEVLLNYIRYPRDQFYNEVLGISYDSGLRPLTTLQLQACCNEDVYMSDAEQYKGLSTAQPIFMGIDWGCHDEETRILTQEGFKFFRDLSDVDQVGQWDPDTRELTFVSPKARTVREWDGELLHFKTKGALDLMVTPTHRMRVFPSPYNGYSGWVTETAGATADRGGPVQFVGKVNWRGRDLEWVKIPGLPTSPGYSGCQPRVFNADDWIEFFGYMVTEGGVCIKKDKKGGLRPYCLKMSQRASVHPIYCELIRGCMERLGIPFSEFPNPKTGDVNWTICGKQYWKWFSEQMGMTGDTKRIPRWMLEVSERQLRILYKAMMLGDGSTDRRPNCNSGSYTSTSKGLCEDFQEICLKLGLRCSVKLAKPAEGNRKARWRSSWSRGRDYSFNTPSRSVRRVPYKGKVYCCSVPKGYIVTERNGCISYQGNSGENTYTVLTLATYIDMVFRVFYVHRFTGASTSPEIQVAEICQLIDYYNVTLVGTDYGGGFDRNDTLIRKYGPQRIHKYQYAARSRRKVLWNGELNRWICHRTEVMSDIFNAIKKNLCQFPRWEEFKDPYAQDFLNIFSEYNKVIRMIMYKNNRDCPDDSFHSLLYCWLVSMIMVPRPDIVTPRKEEDADIY